LIKIKVDAARLEVLDGAEQIDQRAAQPINCHHYIEFALACVLQRAVKARPVVPALGAA
jgi:hypothetical protein